MCVQVCVTERDRQTESRIFWLIWVLSLCVHEQFSVCVVCGQCLLTVFGMCVRGVAGYAVCGVEMTPDKPTDGRPAGLETLRLHKHILTLRHARTHAQHGK